ncbi:hypothetical protein NW768_008349 [Fusarium equiseti]|uniref:Protein kinase domain-containing protein n=1 Tax=Fusarium equiseti TaxID=61235 RepID=A0ABQ8R6T3_FUSEQ|nr:hypothetical protein NW768_008349 [Fusarium equiseti]
MPDNFNLVMELQDGDLGGLARTQEFDEPQQLFDNADTVGRPVLLQMLEALDYLAFKDIIHRDVKPHNILYRRIDGAYHCRLADFGIATVSPHGRRHCGTEPFIAPEVEDRGSDLPHTTCIDVWGLAASICWTFDLERKTGEGLYIDVGHHAICPRWTDILREMLDQDPLERPSAGKVLTLMFNEEGRITDERWILFGHIGVLHLHFVADILL